MFWHAKRVYGKNLFRLWNKRSTVDWTSFLFRWKTGQWIKRCLTNLVYRFWDRQVLFTTFGGYQHPDPLPVHRIFFTGEPAISFHIFNDDRCRRSIAEEHFGNLSRVEKLSLGQLEQGEKLFQVYSIGPEKSLQISNPFEVNSTCLPHYQIHVAFA